MSLEKIPLTTIRCVACEGDVPPLTSEEIEQLKGQIPQWMVSVDLKSLKRHYKFKGFYKTMNFVNAVAYIANQEGHHPDLEVGYNYCNIKWTTHAIDGLSRNDFICAAKVDLLNPEEG